MAVQGALWLAKRYPSTLISVFLTGFRYFSYHAATQLASRGWVDPVTDPILLEKILRYRRESNPGPLGWQSDVLTTILNRWSVIVIAELILQAFRHFTYITAHSPTLPSLYLRHSSFSDPSVASPTSQFILLPFFRFSYVTSSSLNSPGERPMQRTHDKIM